ncbi:MAG: M24 family metallopeptidase, partial [Caldilineaceae bacterium]
MRTDLDRLMAERNLDSLLVMGDAGGNRIMNYLTNGAHLENALVVKRRGGPLTLIHGAMERDNAEAVAAATGATIVNRDSTYNPYSLLQKHEGDLLAARVDYLSQVVRDQQLHGRLGVYGRIEAGEAYAVLNRLNAEIDGEVVAEVGASLFSLARETKDAVEIAEMAEAGRLTSLAVGDVWEFLQGHTVRQETLVKADGDALTIGDVKTFIRTRLNHHGMREDHGCIFAQGRDAGVPHNAGDPAMPLRLGQSIVFDIFPIVPSGYFHDLTRTWSLGYATDEVQQAWDQTKEIFDRIMGSLRVGTPCRDYQVQVCEFYEALGHPTVMSHPGTQEGYVHGLGHGVGLDIHEEPRLSHAAGNRTLLQPGHVVSVEPGLYYPERG